MRRKIHVLTEAMLTELYKIIQYDLYENKSKVDKCVGSSKTKFSQITSFVTLNRMNFSFPVVWLLFCSPRL